MPDGALRGGIVVIEARSLVVEQLPPLVVRRPLPAYSMNMEKREKERTDR